MTRDNYRPRIPDRIRKQLEEEFKQKDEYYPLYEIAGYTSKKEFINQAIQEKIEYEKEKLNKSDNDRLLTGGKNKSNKEQKSRWSGDFTQ